MMKKKYTLSFLKESIQIIANLGGAISVLVYLVKEIIVFANKIPTQLHEYSLLVLFYVFILALIVIFLYNSIKSSADSFYSSFRKKQLELLLSDNIIENRGLVINIDDYIPNQKLISRIYKTAKQEGLQWSTDAEVDTLNMYVEKSGNKITNTFQISINSDWKNEILTVYYPKYSNNYSRRGGLASLGGKNLFFEINCWRKAVIAAYNKVSGTLPDSFKIQIAGNLEALGGGMSINFYFTRNLVEERYQFDFNNGILTSTIDDSSVKIV